MARKRASMREGPLAELFRATEASQRQGKNEPDAEQPEPEARLEPLEETVEHAPPFDPVVEVDARTRADVSQSPNLRRRPSRTCAPSRSCRASGRCPSLRRACIARRTRSRAPTWPSSASSESAAPG